jgi:Tfp pilus assembly protein FimT
MSRRTALNGHTLLELLVGLTILGAILIIALPRAAHALDVFAVRAARETLISASARTRSIALQRSGAQLRIDQPTGTLTLVARDSTTVDSWDLHELYRVDIAIENSTRTVGVIAYDQLGIGRLANLTLRVSRGRATGGVTFSAYGRPRAW